MSGTKQNCRQDEELNNLFNYAETKYDGMQSEILYEGSIKFLMITKLFHISRGLERGFQVAQLRPSWELLNFCHVSALLKPRQWGFFPSCLLNAIFFLFRC
jgi:hypothetical protein